MKEEIERICNNYEMGFISPLEFLMEVKEILRLFGADEVIDRKLSEVTAPFADYVKMIVSTGNNARVNISDFGK